MQVDDKLAKEKLARICEDEAATRRHRHDHPLAGDDPMVQAHKHVTAIKLAQLIRNTDLTDCGPQNISIGDYMAAPDQGSARNATDKERLDWLDGEAKREADWYCTDSETRGPYPMPLFRRNVPITRELIDAAIRALPDQD